VGVGVSEGELLETEAEEEGDTGSEDADNKGLGVGVLLTEGELLKTEADDESDIASEDAEDTKREGVADDRELGVGVLLSEDDAAEGVALETGTMLEA
jgi:hypothetical protein